MSIVTDLIINNEIPVGDIDGANKVFTLTKAPNPEKSLELFLNGKLQVIDIDYTLYNLTITFETAPWRKSILKIHYRYVEIAELYLELARITDAGSLAGQDTADFNDDVDGAEKPENNADVTGDHQGDVDGSNINNDENWTDDVAAAAAQATADGKIVTFLQDTEPVADGVGDLWIDTNDTNKLYRWNGSSWVLVTDTDIAQSIIDAAAAQTTADSKTDDTAADAAQATADSKIITFYQTTAPTAEAVGDLWVDTDDNNKPYRWSGSEWVAIDNPVSDWSLVVDDDNNKPANNATENTGNLADKDTVGTVEIDDNAVNADKINVTTLSAISADIGAVTAGTITGVLIQTSALDNVGIKITISSGIKIYEQKLNFYDGAGDYQGRIYASTGHLLISPLTALDLYGGTSEIIWAHDDIIPYSLTGSINLGNIDRPFGAFLHDCRICNSFRLDQAPTAEVNTATHYVTMNFNGTDYKVLLKSI